MDPNRYFSKEDIQMADRYIEMQIETTTSITSYLSEWLLSKRQEVTSVGKNVEKREPSCTAGGNVNWCSHYGKQHGASPKN